MGGEPRYVMKQERFVANLLPDDSDSKIMRECLGVMTALRVVCDLVGIHEDELMFELGAPLLAVFDLLAGTLQPCDRVTRTGRKRYDFQMDSHVKFSQEIVEKLAIGLFRFALAAEEDRNPLGNNGAAPLHPTCGTAP